MKICIIVPVHNEEKIIRKSIETIISYSAKLPVAAKVLTVNDGSKDLSGRILEELGAIYPESIFEQILHKENKGYGAALRTGIDFALTHEFDYIIFMDSDLTNHPRYIADFYKKMLEGHDYIKATRYGKGAGVDGVPFSRRVVSLWGNRVARLLFGLPLHDLTNGFRAVKTDIFNRIKPRENGFAIIMEELFLSKPLVRSYAEVPYVLTARREGEGKTHFTYNVKTYLCYLKYALKSIYQKSSLN